MVPASPETLLRRGLRLEFITLAWNVVGAVIVILAAVTAGSVALAGFGLDSLIEIGASMAVIWQLTGTDSDRERRALRLIGWAFIALAIYVSAQAAYVLIAGEHPGHSPLGIAGTAATVVVMLVLAAGKSSTGKALGHRTLQTEARVTLIDAYLAGAVLIGLVLNVLLGWWWADPVAGLVVVYYGFREAIEAFGWRT
jgi:divalent metal cation (Fe/Co/Zn/Cd) transporter